MCSVALMGFATCIRFDFGPRLISLSRSADATLFLPPLLPLPVRLYV